MQIQLSQAQELRQEMTIAQKIELTNLMAVPDEVLNVVVGALAYNPKGVEEALQRRKAERKYSDAAEKSQAIYTGLTDSMGIGTNGGTIGAPDIGSLEGCLSGFQASVTPDVTYIGRKNDKPDVVFSDHLKGSFGLHMLQVDSSEYPETAKLLAQLRRFDSWKRGELRKSYIEIGDVQREYFEKYNPARFNLLGQKELAERVGLSSGTISRILENRWVEARNLDRENKYIKAKDLLVTGDQLKRYITVPRINALLKKEFESGDALSDDDISKQLHNVARRTVTKYRHKAGIPTAKERSRSYRTNGVSEPYAIGTIEED